MSLFPVRILLAIGGAEVATAASRAVAELSARTGFEVHLAYVGDEISDTLSHTEFDSEDERARRIEADGGTVSKQRRARRPLSSARGRRVEQRL